jgi:hypothetical protein
LCPIRRLQCSALHAGVRCRGIQGLIRVATLAGLSFSKVGVVSAAAFGGPGPEACKRLIKNCIICWKYLYLSQKLAQIDDPAKREELLQAIAHGSAAAWGHLNLLGEYDFSEDKLQDSVGIKPPKLTD